MNIAFLTEKFPPDAGGLAISTQRLAQMLVAAGHRVDVFAPTTTLAPGEISYAEHNNLRIHRLGAHKRTDDTLADWLGYLAARHNESRFELLHAYFIPQAGFVATYAARLFGLPSIVSARGNDLDRAIFDPGKAAHVLYALQKANMVTANSRDLIRKIHALANREAILISNGIDAAHFAPGSRDESLVESLGIAGKSIIGFVGEARAKKGLATLLLAFRAVAQNRSAALLLIGGVRDGDDKDTLKVFQKQHRDLHIVVVPHVEPAELPPYYHLLDVFALPAIRDGLPNALLEAMACECAVVGTAVGGIPDAVRDNENGLLIPPGNPALLASALHRLLDDAVLRERLAKSARATILNEFTPARELELNLELYQKLVDF